MKIEGPMMHEESTFWNILYEIFNKVRGVAIEWATRA